MSGERGGAGRGLAACAAASAAAVAAFAGIAALALAIGGSSGCGRKAPPRPPQYVIPESPAPVQVAETADGLKLTWHRPRRYADGAPIEDLGGFEIFRACGEGDFWTPIASLEVTDRERFRKGRTFSYVDPDVPADAGCHYRVVAVTVDGYRSAPAESWLGAPTPQPTPAETPSPGPGRPAPFEPEPVEGAGEEPPVPAPFVSATPFPLAPP
ncbi:MAG TPA: hypothetical protein VFD92_15480 [Candidatus Binatia bacterium]|nr:hypothetical protein [Candidatus Binatia bacterium]